MSSPTDILQQKTAQSAQATPAPVPDQTVAAPTPQPEQDSAAPEQDDDESENAPVKIHVAFSKLQESLIKLLDGLGISRVFTLPYIHGAPMADHIKAVGKMMTQSGGMGANLMFSAHHSGGRGYGSGDGHTVAYTAQKLHETFIPAKNEDAKAALSAAKNLISQIKKLIGETPAVQTAESQLDILGKYDGRGLTALDFGVALSNLGAFGHSVATRGKEGGVEDVQKFEQNKQQMQIEPQKAAQDAKNQKLQQDLTVFNTNNTLAQSSLTLESVKGEMANRTRSFTFRGQHAAITPQAHRVSAVCGVAATANLRSF